MRLSVEHMNGVYRILGNSFSYPNLMPVGILQAFSLSVAFVSIFVVRTVNVKSVSCGMQRTVGVY